MEHVPQPKGSNLCGQACIAMIVGCDIKRAIELVGHAHKTKTRDLIKALRKAGIECGDRRIPLRYPVKSYCGIFLMKNNRNSLQHWIVCRDKYYHDPMADKEGDFSLRHRGWFEVSYLPIFLDDNDRPKAVEP